MRWIGVGGESGDQLGAGSKSPHEPPSVVMGGESMGWTQEDLGAVLVGGGREGKAEMTSRFQTWEVSRGNTSTRLWH